VAACDAALNLRWPTARELSGPWLHCLAAGKPTVIVDLAHLVDVPTVDPRTWQPNTPWPGRAVPAGDPEPPCAVAIDILDEDHSLRLAMRRLALDASLRTTLGRAARQYWSVNHSIEGMVADYQRAIAEAAAIGLTTSPMSPAEGRQLPAHLVAAGANTLEGVIRRFGLEAPFQL
jgi:hypothetical protein